MTWISTNYFLFFQLLIGSQWLDRRIDEKFIEEMAETLGYCPFNWSLISFFLRKVKSITNRYSWLSYFGLLHFHQQLEQLRYYQFIQSFELSKTQVSMWIKTTEWIIFFFPSNIDHLYIWIIFQEKEPAGQVIVSSHDKRMNFWRWI